MRIYGLAGLALALVIIGYAWVAMPRDCYGYDEADYMYAVSRGFWANYTDSPSISLSEFVRQGRGAAGQFTSSKRQALSDYIRASGDVPFYRHYHGPVSTYLWIAATQLAGTSENIPRMAAVFCHLAACFLVGCMAWALGGGNAGALLGFTASLLSPVLLRTAFFVQAHTVYTLWVVASLGFAALAIRLRNIRWLYGSSISTAFAVCTIEYGAFLVFAVVASVWLARRQLAAEGGWHPYVAPAAAGVGALLMIWPGGLLKLTLMKNYAFFAYFALYRSSAYGSESLPALWWRTFSSSPVEWVVLIGGFVLCCRRVGARWVLPFGVYATLLVATVLLNRGGGQYLSSLLVSLAVPAAVGWTGLRFRSIVPLAILALAVNCAIRFSAPSGTPALTAAMVSRRERTITGEACAPSLHYYQTR